MNWMDLCEYQNQACKSVAAFFSHRLIDLKISVPIIRDSHTLGAPKRISGANDLAVVRRSHTNCYKTHAANCILINGKV